MCESYPDSVSGIRPDILPRYPANIKDFTGIIRYPVSSKNCYPGHPYRIPIRTPARTPVRIPVRRPGRIPVRIRDRIPVTTPVRKPARIPFSKPVRIPIRIDVRIAVMITVGVAVRGVPDSNFTRYQIFYYTVKSFLSAGYLAGYRIQIAFTHKNLEVSSCCSS